MKRTICILLIVVFPLFLASCGTSDDEYTYDYLPSDYPDLILTVRSQSQAINGGAYLNLSLNNLEGTDCTNKVTMRSLFNDETKAIMPLCWDLTCEHSGTTCFGNIYGSPPQACTGIYEDNIYLIRTTPNVKNQIEVVYYGLDGTLQATVKYAPELTMPNGEMLEDTFTLHPGYLKYGSKLYFNISSPYLGSNESVLLNQNEIKYVIWFVSYDLREEKWDMVASPTEYFITNNIVLRDAKENKVQFSYNGVCYVADADTGETNVYDCAETLDKMVAEGKLPVGTKILQVSALRDYFICNTGEEHVYCKISTKEIVESTEVEQLTSSITEKFVYNGDLYVIEDGKEPTTYVCTNKNTGEVIPFGTDGMSLSLFTETEKGIIFTWLERLEDGSLEPTSYHVKENGKDVTYFYPEKYLYVTKEDIVDGKIDEPWYYDAETYSFVKK